jgi:hypothetical protein
MSAPRIPSFIPLITLLVCFSGASLAQTYTITPEHPTDGDQIQVLADWPNSGNFVDTKTYSITGNSISVRFVQDGLNFGPNPIHIESSITLPPLDAGIYTMRIDWVPSSGPGFIPAVQPQTFTVVVVPPSGANVPGGITVYPPAPTTATPVRIDISGIGCASPAPFDPLLITNSLSSALIQRTINLTVDMAGGASCFSAAAAGQASPSAVPPPISFPFQRLLAGSYTVNFALSDNGWVYRIDSTTFSIVADPNTFVPAGGMWWDPAQSGTGYSIDVQHGELLMTIFSYTPEGLPQWYLLIGQLANNATSGNLLKFGGGQCIDCLNWQMPVAAGDNGMATVTFSSPTTATVQLPGGRVANIVPQIF